MTLSAPSGARIVRFVDALGRHRGGIIRSGEDVIRAYPEVGDTSSTPGSDVDPLSIQEPVVADLESARFLPPVRPRVIACVGLNHGSTQRIFDAGSRTEPLLFLKSPSSVVATDAPIPCPTGVDALDVAPEMAVVIGRPSHQVSVADAMTHVLGVTCANDVAVRAWMGYEGQWFGAKSADGFCPLGPWIVPVAEIADRKVALRVNGQQMQSGSTGELLWGVPELISLVTRHVTLMPGDVILTGSPAGLATARPGDRVEVSIDGIGVLRNTVVMSGERSEDRS